MKSGKLYVFLIVVFLLYTGCNYSRRFSQKNISQESLGKIAVFPFKNHTDSPSAGIALTELFYTELYASEKFDIIPLHTVMDGFQGSLDDVFTSGNVKKIASSLNADTVFLASVSEYKYKKGLRERPVVCVNIQLVFAKTGEVLWSQSITREELQFMFYKGSLSLVSQKVCKQIVNKLTKHIR